MGAAWTTVRDGARTTTLHKSDGDVQAVVHRWEQLVRFASLRLGSRTGADVQPIVPRAHADPRVRFAHLADGLSTSGLLDATIRIPRSAGDVRIVADLRARQLTASTDVIAPGDKGNRGRIGWLLRQLGQRTPGDLVVESWPRLARQPVSAPLDQVRDDHDLLLDPDKRDILRFRLVQRAEMGQSRKDGGRSTGFIQSVAGLVETFYSTVLEQISPWTAPPPRTRPAPAPASRAQEQDDEPIADREDLDDAVDAVRQLDADQPGQRVLRTRPIAEAADDAPVSVDDAYVEAPISVEVVAEAEAEAEAAPTP
jgi:hypothetical protein